MRIIRALRVGSNSFSNVVSLLALFVALGGTAFAATQLSDGQVKGRHIAADAITSPKVKDGSLLPKDIAPETIGTGRIKNRSLLAEDFAFGQLPRGADGSALGFALVVKCSTGCTSTGGYMVDSGNSVHVDNDHFDHPTAGIFCFRNNLEFNGAAAQKLVSRNVVATVGKSSAPMFAQAESAGVGTANVGADCVDSNDPYGPNNAVVRVYKLDTSNPTPTLAPADPDTIYVVFN